MAAEEPYSSTFGALIFWSYILAALYFTGLVIWTIYQTRGHEGRRYEQRRQAAVFTTLAIISFSSLSYHMLNVLIYSYRQWCRVRSIPLPQSLFGPGSLLGSPRIPLYLWQWSKTSTLFKDFGDALISSPATWAWSHASLGLTFINVFFICVQGKVAQVPRLWAFVAIAEILPTSFSQNLFFLVSARQRPSVVRGSFRSDLPWIAGAFGYTLCLSMAYRRRDQLISIILIARVFLALPLLLHFDPQGPVRPVEASNKTHKQRLIELLLRRVDTIVALWACIVPLKKAWKTVRTDELLYAVNANFAVSALGYDFIISCLSWIAWFAFQVF